MFKKEKSINIYDYFLNFLILFYLTEKHNPNTNSHFIMNNKLIPLS